MSLKMVVQPIVYACTGCSVYFMSGSLLSAIFAMFFVAVYGVYEYNEGRLMVHKAFNEVFSQVIADPEQLARIARMVEKVEI